MLVVQLVADTPYGTRAQTLDDVHVWTPAFFALVAGVSLLSAAGLWLGHRWAWALTMLVVGVSLVASLFLYWRGDPPYLRMAIDVVLAFYLNQGAVRDHFERRRGSVEADRSSPS
jgi:membrane protein implicated in regulation of membrane protease activity